MAARDDYSYPICGGDVDTEQWETMCDEIDRLRSDVETLRYAFQRDLQGLRDESARSQALEEARSNALSVALDARYDGEHHKMWVVDQMVRYLLDDDRLYRMWCPVDWDEGIAP
jgi:hypothetical protein